MTWGIRFSNARREGNELVVHVRMTRLRAAFEAARWLREFSRGEPLRVQFAMVAAFAMYAAKHAAKWVALVAVVALALSGCSAREQLRRSVEPLGLYEVQHPLHGSCHEVGVRAQSATINRELVVYGGVCVGRIDAGVMGDAGAVE